MGLFDLFRRLAQEERGEPERPAEKPEDDELEIYSGMRVEVTSLQGQMLFVAKLTSLRGNTAQLNQYSEAELVQEADDAEPVRVCIRGYNDHERKAVYMEGSISPMPQRRWKVEDLVVARIGNDRAFFRLDTNLEATITSFTGLNAGEKPVRLLNISVGGACIASMNQYKGDALLQKVYTTDFLSKKKKKNEGEVPQYYVEGNHEAIIPPSVFDNVQVLMQSRGKGSSRNSCVSIFSSKIRCGDCGSWYGSKVWHSNDKYRRVVWQCNHKFDGGEKCTTPHLDEEAIKRLFIKALNTIGKEKDLIIAGFGEVKDTAFETGELEAEAQQLNGDMNVAAELIQKCIGENARVAQNQGEYAKRYDALVERFEMAKARLEEVQAAITEKQAQRKMMENFMEVLRGLPEQVDYFDEGAWYAMVDFVTVYGKEDVRFTFKNGMEVKV